MIDKVAEVVSDLIFGGLGALFHRKIMITLKKISCFELDSVYLGIIS